jgi:hypothetical protein
LKREVVRVDADAVAADEARAGTCRKFHLVPAAASTAMRVDADAVERSSGELVHEGDVEIALRVLDDLGRLGDLDAWSARWTPAVDDGCRTSAATRSRASPASCAGDDLDLMRVEACARGRRG